MFRTAKNIVMNPMVTGILLYFLFNPVSALGQDIPPIDYYTNGPLLVDSDSPVLTINSDERLDDVTVVLRRGRERETFRLGRISRGTPAEIEFQAELGVHEWDVELTGTWNQAPFELGFEFEFELTEGLEIQVPLDRVDLEARQLELILNRPADRVEYSILSDEGRNMGSGEVSFDGARPGQRLTVNWTQREGTVLKIGMVAYDTSGFWSAIELIPWSVNIPHEEIHFESGRHEIPLEQAYKIDAAYGQLMDAVVRYGQFVEINLYVAGYTDTVGARTGNQSLSERRARSIAESFQGKGFSFPIFFQGFGEDGLAVQTTDSVDEIRNRRALYILAAQPPLPSHHVPRGNWRQLN
jgi:hypothetical protein